MTDPQTAMREDMQIRQIERLMLVDDTRFDQTLYQRIIKRSGLVDTLLPFTEPHEAVAYLLDPETPMPSLILLDVNMPGMNGFELLDVVTQALGPSLCPAVVMLTTSLNPSDKSRAATYDVVRDFLSKPLTEELLGYVSTLQD